MPCDTQLRTGQTLEQRGKEIDSALDRLQRYLQTGTVRVGIAPNGAVAFTGWRDDDRDAVSDVCAYRLLTLRNSWELKQAVARAEAQSGRKVNARAVAAGFHSHDGGRSWGRD